MMTITLHDLVFAALAGLTIFAALGVVLSRNVVHSALFLVLTFLGVAAIFFDLGAGFLGLIQVLVYGGAISVLIIFAIMLVMNVKVENTNLSNPNLLTIVFGTIVAVMLTGGVAISIWFSSLLPRFATTTIVVNDAVGALAELLLGNYVVAFEAAAILLLLAVVGAIILARGVEEK
jgi:NADH-quinone oxidoreductase subunit J